ncbi:MAG: hypothetical protein NW226_26150 [Microscillaceae bacterium]|nr:hypothetical protein [Microscillaceae bacterium]
MENTSFEERLKEKSKEIKEKLEYLKSRTDLAINTTKKLHEEFDQFAKDHKAEKIEGILKK